MIVYAVDVAVIPGKEDDFVEATGINHRATRTEPGNIRFDLCRSQEDPGRFFLYEVYTDEEAVAAHKKTEHYLAWRELVAPWMARPREGRSFSPLFPGDRDQW